MANVDLKIVSVNSIQLSMLLVPMGGISTGFSMETSIIVLCNFVLNLTRVTALYFVFHYKIQHVRHHFNVIIAVIRRIVLSITVTEKMMSESQ